MKIWISIDDTDNLDSRGTGYIARTLAQHLTDLKLGTAFGITRHQLYIHPSIPYTSHNSSLCIHWDTNEYNLKSIQSEARRFLKDQSATDSDPGLCIAIVDQISSSVKHFGQEAKIKVLEKSQAIKLADLNHIILMELGGSGEGIIGALAGAGLASSGNDGRFIWLKGIRDIKGTFTAQEIYAKTDVKLIITIQEESIIIDDLIDVGDWFRPVWINFMPVLLVEESKEKNNARWKIFDREYIKANY